MSGSLRSARAVLAAILSALLVAAWLPSGLLQHAAAATDSGFEIDGDVTPTSGAGTLDWTSSAVTSSPDFTAVHDNAGGDTTGFGANYKEYNWPSWGVTASPPDKSDISDVYTYAWNDSGHAELAFAWTRLKPSGTDGYYLELNKNQNSSGAIPDRSIGDARFFISEQGNNPLSVTDVSTWDGTGWVAHSYVGTPYDVAVNTAPVTPPGTSTAFGADQFVEVWLDLTALLGVSPSCPSQFGYVNFRSITGGSGGNLEDYVNGYQAPAGNTCSTLLIEKKDSADHSKYLAGATFKIEPNPTTGTAGSYAFVTDNSTTSDATHVPDANPADGEIKVVSVRPDDYTITETGAPTGYLIDSGAAVPVTAPTSAAAPVQTFYDTKEDPKIHVVKTASPGTYDSVGDTISYGYTVTNPGNVPLTDVAVVDDKIPAGLSCTGKPTGSWAAGGSFTCTATYTITQADLDAGSVTNLVTASAMYGSTPVQDTDTKTVDAVRSPSLHLVKDVDSLTYDHADQVLHYTYTLTNTGNVTLSAPYSVVDDKIPAAGISCDQTPATLRPSSADSVTCTGTYKVSQAELDAGTTITNNAHGYAYDDKTKIESNLATKSVTASRTVALHLDKAATETTFDAAGQTLHYTYTLTNTGKVTLASPYAVIDDKIASVDCSSATSPLAPGAHTTCSATYTVKQSDVDAGSILNTATATAKDGVTTVTSNQAQASVRAVQRSVLSLAKTALTATYAHVGDVVHYSYALKNTGNVTLLAPYTVNDDVINGAGGSVTCPIAPSSLSPSDTVTCIADYTVTQADLDAGSVHNTAVGHAFFGATKLDSNPSDATVPAAQAPALTLAKTAAEASYAAAGDVLHYTYTLTNSGNVTLTTPYAVHDDRLSNADCSAGPAKLAPGGSFTCTGSYTVNQADVDGGHVVNIATASATVGGKPVTSPQATATVPAVQKPALLLVKNAAEPSFAKAGDVVHYTYTLTNTGNVTLAAPYTVADDKAANVECPTQPATLAPAATVQCAVAYTVTQADVDAGGVTNHATGTAVLGNATVSSNPAEATVPAEQAPALELVKSVDKTSAGYGDTLTYSLSLTNTGNQTLTGVVVSDVVPDGTTYVDGSLAPSSTQPTYTASSKTVAWAVGALDPGATVEALTFQVTIDEPTFDSAVGLPAEVIDNVGEVKAEQVDAAPSNHVKTPVTAVLGIKVVRKPPTVKPVEHQRLPFTGIPAQEGVAFALLLIGAGALLASVRRRHG